MKVLQIIHTHNDVPVITVIGPHEPLAAEVAEVVKTYLDQRAGTRAHHIGVHHHGTVGRLLGVLPPLSGSAKAHNVGRKPRGICAVCRKEYPLNKHGKITKHGKNYGTRQAKRCAGSARFPYVNRDGHE